MKEYVLGFLFPNNRQYVWLIRKKRPEWQKDLLNGIGGHVEENENSMDAMIREFNEETGLTILDWKKFCILTDDKIYKVDCYFSFSDKIPKTMTDEEVNWYNIDCLIGWDVIPNLNWLIPMALSFDKIKCETYIVKESYPGINAE